MIGVGKAFHGMLIGGLLALILLSGCGSGGGGTNASPSSSADTTKPAVSQTSPANGATGIAVNSAISVTFSEAVDSSSVNASTFQVAGVTGTVSVNGTTATFTPSSNLGYNTPYTVTLTTGIKDAAGNTIDANYTCSFTTGALADTTPPTVSSVSPANNATGTAVNASVTATFSEAMDASTMNNTTFTLKEGSTPVSGAVTYSGTTATFTPSSSLSYSTTYTATVTTGVKDAAGNAMASNYSWSFTSGAAPIYAPSAPTGVSASAGDAQATVSWTAATGATSYNIYWSTTAGVTTANGTKIAGVTSPYTHTGRSNGTTYFYIVTAANTGGESTASSQISATPLPPAPSAPTGVSASAGDAQTTISWTVVTGATSYNIYWSTSAGVTTATGTKIASVTSPYTHTGRTNGTTYYYIVTAADTGGESAASSQVSATPLPPVPSAPTGVSASAGDAQATISWSAVTGATSYNIYWSTTVGVTTATGTKITGVTSPYIHTGRTNGTTYYYIVTAANLGGESAASAQVSATPLPPVPTAPSGVSATSGNAQTTINWSAVTGATSYNIYWSTASGVTTANGTKITGVTSPYNHTGLTNGTTYYYIVTAVNLGGESAASTQVSATPNSTYLLGGAMQGLPLTLSANAVTTFTGAGTALDGTGTATTFYYPGGITTDGTNLYVADSSNNKIRKVVIATGVVTTIAGSGVAGALDGIGTAATFNYPNDITTDGTNLYVADSSNNKIRKVVIATGVVTTMAGSGVTGALDAIGTAATFYGPRGITTDGTNLYVADSSNNKIRKVAIATGVVTTIAGSAAAGAVDGTGTAATFNTPHGITTDGTNLYVADDGNNKIRKVVIATGVVSTIAGSGTQGALDGTGTAATFYSPLGITTYGTNLYVADTYNHKIRKVVIATGAVSTIAGGGTAVDGTGTAATFNYPGGITTDGTNLYVADTNNNKIRKVVIATGVVTTIAGSGVAGWFDGTGTAAAFNYPSGITTDGTNLYVADSSNNKIRKVAIATGVVTTIAGSAAAGAVDGTGTAATFYGPRGITTDGTSLYVADRWNNKIRKVVIATGEVTTIAGSGIAGALDGTGTAATFNSPSGITTDGTNLYVADSQNNMIRKIQ